MLLGSEGGHAAHPIAAAAVQLAFCQVRRVAERDAARPTWNSLHQLGFHELLFSFFFLHFCPFFHFFSPFIHSSIHSFIFPLSPFFHLYNLRPGPFFTHIWYGTCRPRNTQKLVAGITGVMPKRTVDPDLAVALGAAAFAGILEGEVIYPFYFFLLDF